MGGGLYLVATPIGNLADITHRALEVLAGVDRIFCEDTRVSGKLLSRFGISTPLQTYHDHNAGRIRPELMARLADGQSLALISDAGTPLINDPGYKLVKACVAAGHFVTAIPGANAPLTALILSALPCDRFYYHGFLSAKTTARERELAGLVQVPGSLIFLESPKRLASCLAHMTEVLGADRPAAVARELTKLYEDVRRGKLAELAAHYTTTGPPKGEIVIVVGPAPAPVYAETDITALLKDAVARSGVKAAAAEIAALTGLNKRDLYAKAILLRNKND